MEKLLSELNMNSVKSSIFHPMIEMLSCSLVLNLIFSGISEQIASHLLLGSVTSPAFSIFSVVKLYIFVYA